MATTHNGTSVTLLTGEPGTGLGMCRPGGVVDRKSKILLGLLLFNGLSAAGGVSRS